MKEFVSHQQDITMLKMYISNNRASKINENSTQEVYVSISTITDFKALKIDRKINQKVSKNIQDFHNSNKWTRLTFT